MIKNQYLVRAEDITSKYPRFAEEIQRNLDAIEENLESLSQQLDSQKKVLSATDIFTIDQDQMMDSPRPESIANLKVSAADLKALTQNYAVVQNLHSVLDSLNATEGRLRSSFPEDGSGKSPLADLEKIRKRTIAKMQEAYTFLRDLAKATAPREFTKFVDQTSLVVSKSIAYEDSQSYLYLFDKGGTLAFANYLHLKNAMDEGGTPFRDLFIVTSMEATAPAHFYVATLMEFEAPTDRILVRDITKNGVPDIKAFVMALHTLLAMDSFDNTIGRMPVRLLINPAKMSPSLFNAAQHIESIQVNEDTGSIDFVLKPTVIDEAVANQTVAQIQNDLSALTKPGQGRLRMSMRHNDVDGRWQVSFFTQRNSSAPQATEDDLASLKERFGLDRAKLSRILHVVNSSAQRLQGRKPIPYRFVARADMQQPTVEDMEKFVAQSMKMPGGADIDPKAVVSMIDQVLARCEDEDDAVKTVVAMMGHRFSVAATLVEQVCDRALKASSAYGGGLRAYVHNFLPQRQGARKMHLASFIERANDDWWDSLTEQQKEGYLRRHPGSKKKSGGSDEPEFEGNADSDVNSTEEEVSKNDVDAEPGDEKPPVPTHPSTEDAPKAKPKKDRPIEGEETETPKSEGVEPVADETEGEDDGTEPAGESDAGSPDGEGSHEDMAPSTEGDPQESDAPTDAPQSPKDKFNKPMTDGQTVAPSKGGNPALPHMSDDQRKFFDTGEYKPSSPARRKVASILMAKAKGIVHHLKESAHEWKTAGKAIHKLHKKQPLDDHDREAIKSVAQEMVHAAIAASIGGGAAAGAVALLHHVGAHIFENTLIQAASKAVVRSSMQYAAKKEENLPDIEEVIEKALNELIKQVQEGDFDDATWQNAIASMGDMKKLERKNVSKSVDRFQEKHVKDNAMKNEAIEKEKLKPVASAENARIKDDDEYTWLKYTGKPISLNFRGKEVTLRPADKFGVRMSSNGKDKRFVIDAPGFGLTKVFTLTPELEKHLSKTCVKASVSSLGTLKTTRVRSSNSGPIELTPLQEEWKAGW